MSAKKTLCDLRIKSDIAKYPNTPPQWIPKPKYNDKTANGLTKCIIDWLRLNEHQAERISNTGRIIDQRKKYVDVAGRSREIGSVKWAKGTGTNGTADISATINGRSVKIEVKIGADKMSPAQVQYKNQIEAAGGLYIIANSFQMFYDWYLQIKKEA